MTKIHNLPDRKTLRQKLRLSEIKGGIHDDVLRSEYDAERLAYLESQGIRVLLFENRELLEIPDYVVGAFDLRCLDNHPACGNKDAVFFLVPQPAPPGQEGRWLSARNFLQLHRPRPQNSAKMGRPFCEVTLSWASGISYVNRS